MIVCHRLLPELLLPDGSVAGSVVGSVVGSIGGSVQHAGIAALEALRLLNAQRVQRNGGYVAVAS